MSAENDEKRECLDFLKKIDKLSYSGPGSGCIGVYDGISCWEATAANTTIQKPCPIFQGLFDHSKTLYKYCLGNGSWEGYDTNDPVYGYTDYKICLTELGLQQTEKFDKQENSELVYRVVSYVELAGISLSILSICISLFIFGYHRSLRCKRTKIHLNLFITILLTSILRLILFIDKLIFTFKHGGQFKYQSEFMLINKAICPIITTVLEFSQLCNFMWMCNEGVYLNILLSYAFFLNNHTKIIAAFYVVGWGLPAIASLIWAVTTAYQIGIDDVCWLGYFERPSYWIIKGPTTASLLIGILSLVNVLRVLAGKLRQNNPSEIEQIKKSAKAAVFLLPLLGVTHIFEVYYGEPTNWIVNLIFSVIKAILVFFQGFFLSVIYCFMNNEVKDKIRRHWLAKFNFKLGCFKKSNRQKSRTQQSSSPGNAKEADKLVEMEEQPQNDEPQTMLETNCSPSQTRM